MVLFLKNALFTVLVPGTVAVYLPLWLAGGSSRLLALPWEIRQVAALPLLALGAAVYFWCLWDFAVHGRGTPAPIDAPKKLVARGLYRYVRNPMYLGVLTVIIGWAVYFGSTALVGYGLAVWATFHLVVLVLEEPSLGASFGEDYQRYRREVGRWIPRRPRQGAA